MRNLKIKAIIPIATDKFNDILLNTLSKVAASETRIDVANVATGALMIKNRYTAHVNKSQIIELIIKAEKEGYDGVFVSVMFDTCGVEEAREIVNIPVIGSFGASMVTSMLLARKFSIIALAESECAIFRDHVRIYGVENNLASIRAVNVSVLDTPTDQLIDKIYQKSLEAVTLDGAEAIMFGCAGFINSAIPVTELLKEKLGKNIPVIDPNLVAINYLELLIKNQLSHSEILYSGAA